MSEPIRRLAAVFYVYNRVGFHREKKINAGRLYATKKRRTARLPAKAEMKLSEFLAVADGERREGPICLPRCLYFSVKQRENKCIWREG